MTGDRTTLPIVQLGKYYPPEWGGVELATKNLAEGLAAAGRVSEVVAFTRGQAASERINGVTVIRCRARFAPKSQPLSLRWLWQAWRRGRRAGTIVVQWPNVLAPLVLPFIRRAQIVTYWQADLVNKGLLGIVVRPLAHYLAARSATLLVNSASYADGSPGLRRFRHKVRALPIGIEDPALGPAGALPEAIAAFLRGRRFALSVGRLVPYKGFDQLIEAAALLPEEDAVVIAGGGPLEARLKALVAERGLGDRVLVAGRLDEAALAALFRHAALFVMSSVDRAEAYGIVQVEAMAHALPIVATDVPESGVSWVSGFGETGAVVPVCDPPALAAAIAEVMARPDQEALRRKSRERFEALFTLERMVANALEILDRSDSDGPEPGQLPLPETGAR